MVKITLICPVCESERIYKHGKARSGLQRYRCHDCKQCFQQEDLYEANKEGIAEKIIERAMNGSGDRDTSRVLGVSITTVIAPLKNAPLRQ